jgi:hypothetical protein
MEVAEPGQALPLLRVAAGSQAHVLMIVVFSVATAQYLRCMKATTEE